jgi:hypothetical protein
VTFKSTNVHQLTVQKMSINNGFTVTLPSNSNMDKHPKNAGGLYTVVLASPLNFSGSTLNDDTRWQVSMISLHYTHNFFNFREDCLLYFVVDKPTVANTVATETPSVKVKATGSTEVDWGEFLPQERTTHWVAEKHASKGGAGRELVGSFEMRKQYYPSLLSLCDDIVAKFEYIFFQRYKLKLVAKIGTNGRVTFTLDNAGKLTMYANNTYLAKILGLKATVVSPESARSSTDTTVVHSLATIGTEAPRLDVVHALYVHADIVEPQHVGNVMVPLAGYVDIRGKPGDRICHTCNPLIYLPVHKSYIDAIQVRITDEHGQDVIFPDNIGNVVLRLHFRKEKGVSLF